MKLAIAISLVGGAAIAVLANTVDLAAGIVIALVVATTIAAVLTALRADERRNGIPTRFESPADAPAPALHRHADAS